MTVKTRSKKTRSKPKGIPIFCSHDKLLPIAKLVPNPRNPNKHPDAQIDALAKIIEANGFRRPIIVSKRSGFVVAGHGRLAAALKLRMKAVPVDFQIYKNEAAEWSDLLADNKIAELAEMDHHAAAEIIAELPEEDRFMTGFPEEEIAPLLDSLGAEQEVEEEEPGSAGEAGPGVTFKATLEQGETIRKAINTVKMNEKPSMSDGRALELISADFLS